MSQFDTAAPVHAATPAAGTRQALARWGRYLARHWRGEFALPTADVLDGLVLGALLAGVAAVLGGPLVDTAEPAVAAVGLTAVWVLIAAITLWQVVGVVRAADRHARAGHGRLAAGGVMVATMLGVLVSVGVFVRAGLPQIVEASQFALGKDPIGEVTLRVSEDGTELEVSGPIVFGVATRVREILAVHPTIATVRLSSPGGRVVEARDLRDLIRARKLTTVAVGNCASACIVAFMGGRDRLLAPSGNLGFHRYRSPGLDESEAEASMAVDRRELGSRGVPAWFLDRAFSTPNSEMWRPSLAEMKVAGIVTGQLGADGRRLAPPADRASIEAELLHSALYAALRQHEPHVYAQVLDAMEGGAREGHSVLEVGARVRPLISRLAAKYVPTASDAAIVDATAVAAAAMRVLQAQSADACYRYIAPGGAVDLTALPFDLRQREVSATAALIETGARGAPHAPGATTPADLQWVLGHLRERFGDEANVIERIDTPDVDRAAVCGVVASLYERALDLPAPRNAQLLRHLLAGN